MGSGCTVGLGGGRTGIAEMLGIGMVGADEALETKLLSSFSDCWEARGAVSSDVGGVTRGAGRPTGFFKRLGPRSEAALGLCNRECPARGFDGDAAASPAGIVGASSVGTGRDCGCCRPSCLPGVAGDC